jgi:diguanylate cyclase (GGDEF)-like protein
MLILVAGDHPPTRRLVSEVIVPRGHEVVFAPAGNTALQLALEKAPDIVITDCEMEGMDGLELCRQLRKTKRGSEAYFLLLTRRTEPEMVIDAFDAGVDDLVVKPFESRILTARVKRGERTAELHRKSEADRLVLQLQMTEIEDLTKRLRNQAMTDELTALPNRLWAIKRLEAEWAFTERTGNPVAVIMADIDHFKRVNDQHGHDVGDVVLAQIAKVLRESIGDHGEVFRWGGEEFLVICTDVSESECVGTAERLRASVESSTIRRQDVELRVTASFGAAIWEPGLLDLQGLLKASDRALCEAKRAGRNRVCSLARAARRSPR